MLCHRGECQNELTPKQTTYCSVGCKKKDVLRWKSKRQYRLHRDNWSSYLKDWRDRISQAERNNSEL